MLTIGELGWTADPGLFAVTWGAFGLAAVTIGALAFLPAVIAVVLAEVFRWRSVFIWLGLGGGLGWIGYDAVGHLADPRLAADGVVPFLAAGFVGGFVYWLIAGRLSGWPLPTSSASGPA